MPQTFYRDETTRNTGNDQDCKPLNAIIELPYTAVMQNTIVTYSVLC